MRKCVLPGAPLECDQIVDQQEPGAGGHHDAGIDAACERQPPEHHAKPKQQKDGPEESRNRQHADHEHIENILDNRAACAVKQETARN